MKKFFSLLVILSVILLAGKAYAFPYVFYATKINVKQTNIKQYGLYKTKHHNQQLYYRNGLYFLNIIKVPFNKAIKLPFSFSLHLKTLPGYNIKMSYNRLLLVNNKDKIAFFADLFTTNRGIYTYLDDLRLILTEKQYGGKDKNIVIKNIKMLLKGRGNTVTPPNFIPMGNFNGELKSFKTIKIVFGVSTDSLSMYNETLGNIFYITRYLNFHHEKYKIAVVIYGKGVNFMRKGFLSKRLYKETELFINKNHVKFYTCYNALLLNLMNSHSLIKGVKPVPMGALKIYVLTHKYGYFYITSL
jgi:intracellular sulfur oxidation DsrE/DsrF family protein